MNSHTLATILVLFSGTALAADVSIPGPAGAVVILDGQQVAHAPARIPELNGSHHISVVHGSAHYDFDIQESDQVLVLDLPGAAESVSRELCTILANKKAAADGIRTKLAYAKKYSGVIDMAELHDSQEEIQEDDDKISDLKRWFRDNNKKPIACAKLEASK